jgi:hypothetical protein
MRQTLRLRPPGFASLPMSPEGQSRGKGFGE